MKRFHVLTAIVAVGLFHCKQDEASSKKATSAKKSLKKDPPQPPVAPPPAAAPKPAAEGGSAWQTLWTSLPKSEYGCDAFDYWPNGGMRNFSCHARTIISYDALSRLSGLTPFRGGPHSDGLDLESERDFGRYNSKFVRWLVDNAVPGAEDDAFREKTQQIYDKYVRTLARAYLRAKKQVDSSPEYKEAEKAYLLAYLDKPKGTRPLDRHDALEPPDMYNIYKPAVAFWIRRSVDGTDGLFAAGLNKLVRAYDSAYFTELDRMNLAVKPVDTGVAPTPELSFPEDSLAGMIKNLWAHAHETETQCPDQFEYRPGGMRVWYCRGIHILTFETFKEKVGVEIFLSGPHKKSLDLNNDRSFGHYNPKFVQWLIDNAVPAATDPAFLAVSQPAYDQTVRYAMRAFYVARLYLDGDPETRATMQKKYQSWIETGKGDNPRWAYWQKMPEPYDLQAIAGSGVAFWLRRHMDGTAGLFAKAQDLVMATYDKSFVTEVQKYKWHELSNKTELFEVPAEELPHEGEMLDDEKDI